MDGQLTATTEEHVAVVARRAVRIAVRIALCGRTVNSDNRGACRSCGQEGNISATSDDTGRAMDQAMVLNATANTR